MRDERKLCYNSGTGNSAGSVSNIVWADQEVPVARVIWALERNFGVKLRCLLCAKRAGIVCDLGSIPESRQQFGVAIDGIDPHPGIIGDHRVEMLPDEGWLWRQSELIF